MSRPATKSDLIAAATKNYEEMNQLISALTEKELSTPFDFSGMKSKKEAHWKRDKNLRDVLIHLYEWHKLLLDWISSNQNGDNKPFLPEPYNWRTYGDMNVELWQKHQNTTLEEAKELLKSSHAEVMRLLEGFSNEELFSKGVFPWCGENALGSFFTANTSSHYDWAMKKLKSHKRICS